MSNMSYCRFRNIEDNLEDCISALEEVGIPQSKAECQAVLRMQEKAKFFIELVKENYAEIAERASQE